MEGWFELSIRLRSDESFHICWGCILFQPTLLFTVRGFYQSDRGQWISFLDVLVNEVQMGLNVRLQNCLLWLLNKLDWILLCCMQDIIKLCESNVNWCDLRTDSIDLFFEYGSFGLAQRLSFLLMISNVLRLFLELFILLLPFLVSWV